MDAILAFAPNPGATPWWDVVAAVSTALAVLAAFIAIWWESIWAHIRRPKLTLETAAKPPHCDVTPRLAVWQVDGQTFAREDGRMVNLRLWVRNTGKIRAASVQVFVERALSYSPSSGWSEIPTFHPMNLTWSHASNPEQTKVYLEALSPNLGAQCDLGFIAPDAVRGLRLNLRTEVVPFDGSTSFPPGTYAFDLAVAAANAATVRVQVSVSFGNEWRDDPAPLIGNRILVDVIDGSSPPPTAVATKPASGPRRQTAQPTLEECLHDLRERLRISESHRPSQANDSANATFLAAWLRAEQLAAGVLRLADAPNAHPEPIGVLARSLWEGAVRMEYLQGNPPVRVQQLVYDAYRMERPILEGEWHRDAARDIKPEYFAGRDELLKKRKSAEDAYLSEREKLKSQGQPPSEHDLDRMAGLPSVEDMAKSINAKGQYDGLYRTHSLAVHWGLPSLSRAIHAQDEGPVRIEYRNPEEWRHVAVATSALSFAALTKICAELSGQPTEHFQRVDSPVTRTVFPERPST